MTIVQPPGKGEPNQTSKQDMIALLRILAGDTATIINPELLLEDGELFKEIDIYGLAATINGLRVLIENSFGELEKRIEKLEKATGFPTI